MKKITLLATIIVLVASSIGHAADTTLAVTPGSGTTIVVSPDGSGNVIPHTIYCDRTTPTQCAAVSSGGAAKVDGSAVTQPVSGTFWQTTQPVSGTVAATQSGTWTIQPGNTANTTPWLATINQGGNSATVSAGGALKVDASASTQPVSGTIAVTQSTSPWIIAGAGTAGSAASAVLTVQGIASMTKLLVTPDSVALPANQSVNVSQVNGVTTLANAGAVGTGAQRVAVGQDTTTIAGSAPGTAGSASTNVVTVQGIASMTKLLVTPDANSAVNLAQVGGTTVVNGGVAGSQSVGGTVATNVAITANPVNLGVQAVSSENAAVTTARQVQLVADLVGKLIVLPYANPENFVSGVITSAMTGTTSTSLIAAPASGLRNYITQCTFSNSHATVGTMMILQDGNGGTTIYSGPAAAVFGGVTITFPTPLRQPTTATALYVQNVTTGASTFAACSGYKGA